MRRVSRRDFGKGPSRGALGALAATSVPPLASPQGEVSAPQIAPKRMTTVLRELIKNPGFVDAPSIHDPLTAKIAEMVDSGMPPCLAARVALSRVGSSPHSPWTRW